MWVFLVVDLRTTLPLSSHENLGKLETFTSTRWVSFLELEFDFDLDLHVPWELKYQRKRRKWENIYRFVRDRYSFLDFRTHRIRFLHYWLFQDRGWGEIQMFYGFRDHRGIQFRHFFPAPIKIEAPGGEDEGWKLEKMYWYKIGILFLYSGVREIQFWHWFPVPRKLKHSEERRGRKHFISWR